MKGLIFLLGLWLPILLTGQTNYSGEIDRNTRWFGRIVLEGDVIVPKGVTLSIEPGTRILIQARDKTRSGKDPEKIEIIVNGTLLASGLEKGGEILFTSYTAKPKVGDWHGIVLKNRTQPSILRNCIIEYAYNGITCYGSSPQIIECEIRYNHYAGISCEIRSAAVIENCLLVRNGFAGLNCELAAVPVVSGTTIRNNKNGVIIFDRSQPDLGQSPPADGGSGGGNRILDNLETDINNRSSRPISAQNNTWGSADLREIPGFIIDQEDDPAFGRVRFDPVFRAAPVLAANRRPAPPVTTPAAAPLDTARIAGSDPAAGGRTLGSNGTAAAVPAGSGGTIASQQTGDGGTAADSLTAAADAAVLPENGAPAIDSTLIDLGELPPITPPALRETLIVYVEKPGPADPPIKEPVPEAMLDSGRRQYANQVLPVYPEVYKRTGFEGRVQIRVIVGRDGKPESVSVVSSSDKLFAAAAEQAVQRNRYQPGTVRGKPVKFRIYETFVFQLEK